MDNEGLTDTKIIWRYMDLPRFVGMLSTGGLWFSKASAFQDDPWEGFGRTEYPEVTEDNAPKLLLHTYSDGTKKRISVQQMAALMGQASGTIFKQAREHLYVNSWCLDPSESMAMWQIYGSSGCGVAVKSSIDQYLRAATSDLQSLPFLHGAVSYHNQLESTPDVFLDFRNGIPLPGRGLVPHVLRLGLQKRSCYAYEREWRAILYQDQRPEIRGIHENFDLEQLISEVHVGPRAPGFVVDAVSSIMEKFQLGKPLRQSHLLRSPAESHRT